MLQSTDSEDSFRANSCEQAVTIETIGCDTSDVKASAFGMYSKLYSTKYRANFESLFKN